MPSIKITAITLLLFCRFAVADDDPPSGPAESSRPAEPAGSPAPANRSQLSGRVVDAASGVPVEGAQVRVRDTRGDERLIITDRAGRYTIDVGPGTHDLVFTFGTSHMAGQVSVEPGRPATLDGRVDSTSGEVIRIEELRQPKVKPRPSNFSARRAPPYSDEALDKDAWTRAWMVLDVSPQGEVTRFKFVKRPGYDLEKIAADEVFRLRFEPARDDNGKPVRVWLVWSIEWVSAGYLGAFNLPRTMRPPTVGFPPRSMTDYVPCKGSGPMLLHSRYPTYRDCSGPDLKRMPHEPWVVKPVSP